MCVSSSAMMIAMVVFAMVALAQTQDVSVGTFLTYDMLGGKPYNVTYDERSFIIDNQRTILLGGSFHYPRASPGDWPAILQKARNDGLNHVQIYVFWNYHEFKQGQYDFSGRGNLTYFFQLAAEAGLFVNVRIGPYVCAEWNYGGLPVWLNWIPGIIFRDDNAQWEYYMGNFVTLIANMMEPYLARNGGPIILAQIENEYHGSQTYVDWCGNFTVQLALDIPWIMCNGMSAPQTINTCNGNDCAASYAPSHAASFPGQPLAWTENEGWFEEWSMESDYGWDDRTPEDMANVIAKWFAVGAAHHNYYMWYGGNHVGRWAASSITNMYTDGVNWHSDGLPNEPKRSHLAKLHSILADNNAALMGSPSQIDNPIPIGPVSTGVCIQTCSSTNNQQNFTFVNGQIINGTGFCLDGTCSDGNCYPATLLPCTGAASQQFTYNGNTFVNKANGGCLDAYGGTGPEVGIYSCNGNDNQAWTVSASENRIESHISGSPCLDGSYFSATLAAYVYQGASEFDRLVFLQNLGTNDVNVTFEEALYDIPAYSVTLVDENGVELFNSAKVDTSSVPTERVYTNVYGPGELSWTYWTESVPNFSGPTYDSTAPLEQLNVTQDETEYLFYTTYNVSIPSGGATLSFQGWRANSYSVFINGRLVGSSDDISHSGGEITQSVNIPATAAGVQTLTILSGSLGINNAINNQEPASDQEKKGLVGNVSVGSTDITNNGWVQRPFLTGEILQVYTQAGHANVTWIPTSGSGVDYPLTWFTTTFANPPSEGGVVLINMNGAGRGHFYINGIDMGRYWTIEQGGKPVQQYYYVPRDYLQATNTLVLCEELGVSDLSQVSVVLSTVIVPTSDSATAEHTAPLRASASKAVPSSH